MADRSVVVRLLLNAMQFNREMTGAGRNTDRTTAALQKQGTQLVKAEKDLDRYSGRLRLIAEAGATLGPGAIPLGAGGIQALAGIASGLIAIGGGAGTAILALNGVGDALDALNEYQMAPSAEGLKTLREELDKIGPAGEHFVRYLDALGPELEKLQRAAQGGFLPGLEDGIDAFMVKAPQVQRILETISAELGDLSSRAGGNLGGEDFEDFFNYLETDAAPTLRDFAEATGNLVQGLGELVVAFAPLSRDFSGGLVEMTEDFAKWSDELSKTEGFKDFVDYVRESGPAAIDFLGALSMALVDIITAAAPFGAVLLPMLTDFLQLISAIAESPIGPELFTAAAGFIALNRATRMLGPGIGNLSEAFLDLRTSPNVAATAVERFGGVARSVAGAAGMGLFLTSLNETNKTLRGLEGAAGGAMAGFAVGGPWGAAVGGAIGLLVSLGTANDDTSKQVAELAATFEAQTGAITENTRAKVVQSLQDEGMLDAANQLGISTQLVTDAVMGQTDAQNQLNAALAGYEFDATITSVDDLKKSFTDLEIETILNNRAATELQGKIPGLSRTFSSAKGEAEQFASAMTGTADAGDEVANSIARSNERIRAQRGAAREAAQQWVNLGDSVDDAKVSLQGWLKDLEDQAAALAAFGSNAAKAARRGLDEGLIASLEKMGPAGALRMRQLANATEKEIARANRAWSDLRNGVGAYVNMRVPEKVIRVRADGVFDTINAVKYALSQIKDRTVNINVLRRATSLDKIAGMGAADGTTVPKTGGAYADRHPYMLADGEEVVGNRFGQADKNRGALKAANRGAKLAVVGGLAKGGTAGDGAYGFTSGFGLAPDVPGNKDIRSFTIGQSAAVLLELGKTIKSLRGSIKDAERAIRLETKERDRLSEVVDTNRAKVEELTGLYNNLSSSIQQGLQQDLWAKAEKSDPWRSDTGSGSGEPRDATFEEVMTRIQEDTANAAAFTAAEGIVSQFLSGSALESVIGSGDLGRAQMFANLTPEQLKSFQAAYGGRELALTTAGTTGAEARFGVELGAANEKLSESVEQLHQANRELAEANRILRQMERSLDRAREAQEKTRDHLRDQREEQKSRAQDAKEEREADRRQKQKEQRDAK